MDYQIEVFYDGDCPLCIREINMLRNMDKHHRIKFTDISSPEFNITCVNLTMQMLMDRIHGRLPDGTLIEGVEVFRQLYSAVGFTWIVKLTRIPGISHLLDWGYRIFAKNRLKWTGRCADGSCKV